MLSNVNCQEENMQQVYTNLITDLFSKGSLQDATHFHSLIQVCFPSEETEV